MKLIAYKTFDYNSQRLVPASRTREWMDKTPGAFAYHCLPLIMANSLGWFLINDVACEMEWDGTPDTAGLKVWPMQELSPMQEHFMPSSHFGSGVVTWHSEFMFWTEENICMITKGPTNTPKHGITPLEGVIETDWLPYPFTINWKMTQKNVRVRFERGEPIAQLFPYPSELLSQTEPEIESLKNNVELFAKFEDYRKKRTVFNEKFKDHATKRQKYYVRGEDSLGHKTENHRTDWKVKSFADKTATT